MSTRPAKILAVAAAVLTALSVASWAARVRHSGLSIRITEADGSLLVAFNHTALGGFRIDALAAAKLRPARAEWTGYWNVPEPGFAELVLKSDGEARLELDGELLLGTGTNAPVSNRTLRSIPAGPHRLRVTYLLPVDRTAVKREIFLKGVTADGRSVPVERRNTSPRELSPGQRVLAGAERLLPFGALLAWSLLLAVTIARGDRARFIHRAPLVALGLVTLLAGALRMESLVFRYWGPEGPDWAEALASDIRGARGGPFEHAPYDEAYGGDPFSYLMIARSMGNFYEPSSREPLFPALTRFGLWLSADQDIGINFVSALGSTLACLAVFALGARLLSPWSGLLAALLWAIEWQVISFSVEGWRDDLFSLEVAACAAALVALHLHPTRRVAIVLGVASGLTLLTRLSALTFLVPGLLAAVLLPSPASRRDRMNAAGVAAALMALLAGPFMISCALAFGDPFHAVNVHARFYSGRAGLSGGSETALQFLAASRLPWDFVETGFVGLTSFPFFNKWFGFGAWLPELGGILRWLALAGLPVILLRPGGLLTLIILFASIAPYAWTWGIPGGGEWRFTLPAYPFYLVSAALAVEAGLRGLMGLAKPESRRELVRPMVMYVALALGLATLIPWVHRQLDWLRVSEAIVHGRPALIEAGAPARPFFASGFRLIESEGGTRAFEMVEPEGRVCLPLAEGKAARVVIRRGVTARPMAPLEVWAGAERLTPLSSLANQGETMTFEIPPRPHGAGGAALRGGCAQLELRLVRPPSPETTPVHLLWIRVDP